MELFANASLPNQPAGEASLGTLGKRPRLSDNLSRFARPQDYPNGARGTGQGDGEPGASQDLDRCEDQRAGKKSVMSHVATEQRRRDRINEGFNALRDLIPHKDKMDKATFLQQTVEYIKQLQAVMHQLLAMGAIKNLPEETQWSIRLLLPRKSEEVTIPAAAAAPVQLAPPQLPAPAPLNSSSSGMMANAQYLPYLLQQPAPQPTQQAPQQQQGPQQGLLHQTQMQGADNAQMGQQLAQQPQGQQLAQQVALPSHSTAPTVELKAPNNQSQTVQLDLTNMNNMLQLQALLQQSQMQMAQQQAVRQLWSAGQEANPWNMSQQLQQMMQPQLAGAGLQLNQETLTMLANQQALNLLLPQAAAQAAAGAPPAMAPNPTPQQAPTQMMAHQTSAPMPVGNTPTASQPTGQMMQSPHQLLQAASGQLPQMVTQVLSPSMGGCGSGSQPDLSSSEPSSPDKIDRNGLAKLRKNGKVRRHTTASKIIKPPTGPLASSNSTGRPDSLSLAD